MAKSNPSLIQALRETASRLEQGARYEWGHMGRCNCGHLVQTLTDMSDYEIVQSIDFETAEWTEHAKDYCEGTGHKVDDLFSILSRVGFSYQDVIQLENLADKRVLDQLRSTDRPRYLTRNNVAHVQLYMNTLADLLESDSILHPITESSSQENEFAPIASADVNAELN